MARPMNAKTNAKGVKPVKPTNPLAQPNGKPQPALDPLNIVQNTKASAKPFPGTFAKAAKKTMPKMGQKRGY